MNWSGPDRWQKLWKALGATGASADWYHTLTRAYGENTRHYHNQQHIADCLSEFDSARHLAKKPDLIEFALWFHDVVYDTHATNNEEQSAAMASRCLEAAGRTDIAEQISALIIATKLHKTTDGDASLMVDVDLSILGADEAHFTNYETAIRNEYSWVPQEVFNSKRAEILQRFLDRQRIYATDHFAHKYELQARRNLERSIHVLTVK